MSYQKQNFANGEVLTAPQLNHIEDGIVDLESAVNENKGVVDKIIDPTLSLSGKAADAKATGDALARKAVIDDTAVGTDAWSSKHIVDMLCPPMEETGNPVTCYPVAGYPLGCKVSWEPTQEGSGEPSPENVRPIHGRDSVTVGRCGENLLNPEENANNTYTPYGLTITYIGDNKVHLSGTYQEDGGSFVILNTQQKLLTGKGLKITGFTIAGTKQSYTLYGLRTKDETLIAMQTQFVKGDVIDMTVAIVVSQDTPTTYAPYTGQTATLTLPRTIYGGTMDAVTGDGQETWKKPFDFSEYEGGNKITKGKSDGGWAQADNAVPWFVYDDAISPTSVVCDKLKAIANISGETIPYTIGIGQKWIGIRGPWPTAEEVRTWLRQQKPMVSYQLTAPTPFTATGAQPISALSGVNILLTDADSVTVTGRADHIKRITDLEDAVASMT